MIEHDKDIESQIRFAVSKYGGNRPTSVARAEAERIVEKAMKNYDVSMGNVKTYLSSRLQKMSRSAYKASSPINIPESRLMARTKLRSFIEGYKDTHGFSPSASDVSEGMRVSKKEAERMIKEYVAVRAESSYSGFSESPASVTIGHTLDSMPNDLRGIAGLYLKDGKTDAEIRKVTGIPQSSLSRKKKKITELAKQFSYENNIERV